MATVTITGSTTRDSTARQDNRPWYVEAVGYQDGGDGGVITPRKSRAFYPVAGVLTMELEAGIVAYVTNPDGGRYLVTVPDEDSALWDLIAADVLIPPGTSQEALDAALAAYLTSSASSVGEAILLATTEAGARQAIGTLGVPTDYLTDDSGDYMVNDVVRYTDPAPSPTTDLTGLYACITDHTVGSPKDFPSRWRLVAAGSWSGLAGKPAVIAAGASAAAAREAINVPSVPSEWDDSGDGDYMIGDLVTRNGSLYRVTVDHTSGDPETYVGTRYERVVFGIDSDTAESARAAISALESVDLTLAFKSPAVVADPPITRAGTFSGLARWLRSSVDHPGSGSAALVVITDSTGTNTSAGDGDGWPQVLAEALADVYPNVTTRLRRFDYTSTLKMLPATVLHESSYGRPKYGIGLNWAYYLTLPYGVSGLKSAKDLLDGDDLDFRIKFAGVHATLDGQTIPLISNYGPTSGAADRGVEFYMGTDSTISVRVSTSSTTWATFNSTAALPYTDGVAIWVRAVLDRDNGASGKTVTFYYSTDDAATWTTLGSAVTISGVLSGVQDTPDWYWEIGTRQAGLTYSFTVNGSPTAGGYVLKFYPDNDSYIPGTTFQTSSIAYDADNATIQAAIRAITGHNAFADAVVTGTTTKTITFTKPVRYANTSHTLTGGTAPSVSLSGSWFMRAFDCYEIEIRKGADGPLVCPSNVWDWDIAPSRVNYSGGPMLDIINFAHSGRSVQNFVQAPWLEMSTPNRSTLAVILATSHNENQLTGPPFAALLDTWRDLVLERLPNAAIAVGTENPQVSPSVVIDYQSARSAQLAAWAARNGMTVVDTFTAFLEDPRWESDGGDLLHDDRHPTHEAHATIIAPMMQHAIERGY